MQKKNVSVGAQQAGTAMTLGREGTVASGIVRIAVLASHGGSILQAVMDACAVGDIKAEVALVVSNNSGALALRRAAAADMKTLHLSSRTHPQPNQLDDAICIALKGAKADWVLLAGYMKKLGPKVLSKFRHRILNAHPALLPKYGGRGFYGRNVHQAVVDAGETETGATIHLVDQDYDTGPIIAQARVPIHSWDRVEEVEERVKLLERGLVVKTLAQLVADEAQLDADEMSSDQARHRSPRRTAPTDPVGQNTPSQPEA